MVRLALEDGPVSPNRPGMFFVLNKQIFLCCCTFAIYKTLKSVS